MTFSTVRSDARVLRQVRLFSERYAVTTLGYGPAPDGVVEHLRLPDDVVNWHKDRRLLVARRFEAWAPRPPRYTGGVMAKYARTAYQADDGAATNVVG